MERSNRLSTAAVCIAVVVALVSSAIGRPPSDEAIAKWKAEGVYEEKIAQWQDFLKREGLHLSTWTPEQLQRYAKDAGLDDNDPTDVDTINLCVIIVDFSDNQLSWGLVRGDSTAFDSVLFGDGQDGRPLNPTGSMTDYYLEVSYGQLYVTGKCYGPFRMPETYVHYTWIDDGLSRGSELATDAAVAANNVIDYTQHGTPGLGMHGLTIIHAGLGAESGATGIWSHAADIGTALTLDGVAIVDYIMNPEEVPGGGLSPIGVFCHEYGHTLGWPDYYDTQYNPGSSGLGRWCLMASGSYNGNSMRPAHPNGRAKQFRGWLPAVEVLSNMSQVEIAPLSTTPSAYYMSNQPGYAAEPERFFVENRQPYGFDEALPGFGLLIYHQDFSQPNNNNPNAYQVGVVQADGLWSMNFGGSSGDGGDPFPGTTNNRELHAYSYPNTHLNTGDTTQIGIWNISDSDSLMYADLDVTWSRPWLVFTGSDSLVFTEQAGDGDGYFEAGETVAFNCRVKNLMRNAAYATVTLSADAPELQFVTNGVLTDLLLSPLNRPRLAEPIVFSIPSDFETRNVNFTLSFEIDSTISALSQFHFEFQFQRLIGTPELLIVDDDNGVDSEEPLKDIFDRLGIGYAIWESQDAADAPDSLDLMEFPYVFWITGPPHLDWAADGQIGVDDRAAIRGFLNHGGNLCISSASTAEIQDEYAPTFLSDYLHAGYPGTNTEGKPTGILGLAGNAIGGDLVSFEVDPYAPGFWCNRLTAVNGGSEAFTGIFQSGTMGVTYSGAFRTVLMSCPIEYLAAVPSFGEDYKSVDTLVARIMQFFGRIPTDVGEGEGIEIPESFSLDQNYPNPFNPTTTISYAISPAAGGGPQRTQLVVYNALGQRVRTLVDKLQYPGGYVVDWNGTDDAGRKVSTGVYLYRLTRGDQSETRKMILLK
ncbi:MAG: M6 family metalloprotease domain-containing protein [candidate division Zixibacteria bacterium]|nr:M6 family metalloprotease domain-containing protein [candidate division Zixibacteria bacterium]